MSGRWIFADDSWRAPRLERVGGKAVGLWRLRRWGFAVPRFRVLTAEFFRDRGCGDVVVLGRVWRFFSRRGLLPLAVRSSAMVEDQPGRSYAGQFDTVLGVETLDDMSAAVQKVWRSREGDRAAEYGLAMGRIPVPNMAVVVQRMIEPDYAGVAFSVDPVTGADETVVHMVAGTGSSLVGGAVDALAYTVSTDGTVTGGVADSLRGTVRRIAVSVKAIERRMGRPVDVEFAVKGGKLWLLQVRPITSLPAGPSPTRLIWDNANIIESYAGITSPLTFSFIQGAYATVYRQFCGILGISPTVLANRHYLFDTMLGIFNGRVYYNLKNWYTLVSFLPAYRYNKGFMETMMGVRTSLNLPEQPPSRTVQRLLVDLPRALRTGLRLLWWFATMRRRMGEFVGSFDAAYRRYGSPDCESMDLLGLIELNFTLERVFLRNWTVPVVNDFKAMICYGVARRLSLAWIGAEGPTVLNDLLACRHDVESTRALAEARALARVAAADPEVHRLFDSRDDEGVWESICTDRRYCTIRGKMDAYLAAFGARGIGEMKLESRTLKDDPPAFVALLRSALSDRSIGNRSHEGRARRRNAQAVVRRRIRGARRMVFDWVLRHTAESIADRERQRLRRARVYDTARGIARAFGRRWALAGHLDRPDDIFYLELGETRAFVGGTMPCPELKALVRMRKQAYQAYAGIRMPDRFETKGEAAAAFGRISAPASDQAGVLRGTGCSSGVVQGPVIVVEEPSLQMEIDGRIAVTRQTDPGWIFFFTRMAGLIVERGSMLSHSAIVARETGLPAVFGVEHATLRLHTGDLVRLDGGAGTVTVVSRTAG